MEWKIKYCTCMWCGISPLKEQGVTIPRIYPLYLGYHHTSLICHIISHYIVGGIFNPSVYPRMSLCFFFCEGEEEEDCWQTLAYAQFRLHCQQFFHFWLFPHANFSTSYCFSTILCAFFFLRLTRFVRTARRHDKWCQRSCIVFRKAKQSCEFRVQRKGKERKGKERRGKERKEGEKERDPDSVEKCALQNQHKHSQRSPSWPHSGVTCRAKSFSNAKNPSEKVRLKGESFESIWEGIDYHNWNKLSSKSQIPTNVGSQKKSARNDKHWRNHLNINAKSS